MALPVVGMRTLAVVLPFHLGRRPWRVMETVRRALALTLPRREPPLLATLAAEFAAELASLLHARGEPVLTRAVPSLSVVDLCRCNDPRCASFYTLPRFVASWRWPQHGRTLDLGASVGTVRVDVVVGQIISVEVLDRPEL